MLRIAVSKGRLFEKFLELLSLSGAPTSLDFGSRQLVMDSGKEFRFVLAKPADVPTYVEYGATDLGIVGKDTLGEAHKDVAELLDLQYGRCTMVVAVPKALGITSVGELDFHSRVATKYPRTALEFFQSHGIQAEMIPLHGSIELGPLIGLSEAIVDVTETGRTLAENGLVPIGTIMESSCRLIANRVSYRLKYQEIQRVLQALKGVIECGL